MKPERKIHKHPLAVAWDEWLASDVGKKAIDPATLGRLENASTYLTNRLHLAFEAGAQAQALIINCPGCGDAISEDNVGGYRTFCSRCVKAMPPIPQEGAWNISGKYPNFQWVKAD